MMGDMTGIFTPFAVSEATSVLLLVLQAAGALVLFVFEPSDVFRGIGKTLQAGFEYG